MIATRAALAVMTILALAIGGAPQASASPVLISNRADLAGDDFIDWGGLGDPFTPVGSPFAIGSSGGGVTATVSNPGGSFLRVDEDVGWAGNFALGDHLLRAQLASANTIDIVFSTPLLGAGAQIQRALYTDFSATLQVFDASNILLDTFTVAGFSEFSQDNSAIFLGVLDTMPVIKRIAYTVDDGLSEFAINQLDVATPVPEPATLLLLGSGLAGLGAAWRRNRRREKTSPSATEREERERGPTGRVES